MVRIISRIKTRESGKGGTFAADKSPGRRGRHSGLRQVGAALMVASVLALMLLGACRRSEDITQTPATEQESQPESAYPQPETPNPLAENPYPADPSATPTRSLPYPAISTPVPADSATATRRPSRAVTSESSRIAQSFAPILSGGPTATSTPTPRPTDTPRPTPTPTIDFRAVRAQLQAQGQDLGFVKIGLHTGIGGNRTGLGDWMQRLNEAGVPFFLKSADDAGPLFEAQEIARNSDVPHTLVFRRSGDEYDTPDYELSAVQAARQHWQLHKEAFPVELDPSIVWIETINEVDKDRSEWLAVFALETAQLALADGYRWAAFGWSSGEPEPADWSRPNMLRFLRLAAANPDRLAIALHEYSYTIEDIGDQYPFKVGRFQQLYEVADRYGIARPTVLITEWGWEYRDIPSIDNAIRDIEWASNMYAPYPEVKGAALWYLGGSYGEISDKTQRLIIPLTNYALGNYFAVPLPPAVAPIDPAQFSP